MGKKFVVFLLAFLLVYPSFAKKFNIRKGDIIQGVFKVGVILPLEYTRKVKVSQLEKLKKEPIQVYPVSISFSEQPLKDCNGIGYVIYNPPLGRFYGTITQISCNENGKIKDYKTKGYILDGDKNIGVNPVSIKPNVQTFILFVEKIQKK